MNGHSFRWQHFNRAITCVGMVMSVLMLGSVGCVTSVERREPAVETVLLVSKSENTATLQWESDAGAMYTVLQSSSRSAKTPWVPLPGYTRIRGTGQAITINDQFPRGQTRFYRLHTEPIVTRR